MQEQGSRVQGCRCSVDHDCQLGDGVYISPGACLAGGVTVGDLSWLGLGAAIIQHVSIGENVTVGAGAVITKNIPGNITVVGIPGKVIKVKETLEEK